MGNRGFIGGFYQLAEKVMRIAQFQLLWIGLTFCGGIVLGVMPATVGLYTVMRKWIVGNEDNQSYVRLYWTAFRKEFWKANALGLILTIAGFLIYLNFSLIRFSHGFMYWFLLLFVFMLSILFLIILLYLFPVFVHFEGTFTRYISIALLLGLSFPFHTLLLIIGYYVLYLLFFTVPGMIPFFSVALFSCLSMWVSLKVFQRVEGREGDGAVKRQVRFNALFQRNSTPAINNKGDFGSST
ncbi:YesL family protein [Neobacillus sp. 19]|uniref:YesL family protein n=1 Tax=Neobacillus sp. 19 TaxID=3394458 RepID=UPI003BF72823